MIRFTYLLLGLSILVTLHELGHYIAARIFKTRVEKFYLFFDFLFPFPHIMNFALFKKKIGDTEYGLGWFPFGGYVKIAGMIDESMDEEFLKSEPKPWEFRSKPAWQRLIIMLGGITVNLLLGFFIYSMILWHNGTSSIPMKNARYGFVADSLAQSIGLRTGDKILGYDHKHRFEDISDPIVLDLLLNDAKTLQIERNGQKMDIDIPESVYETIVGSGKKISFLRPAFPFDIDSITNNSPLKGIAQKNDRVIYMNDQPIRYFYEMSNMLLANAGKDVTIGLLRGQDTIRANIKVPQDGMLSIYARSMDNYFHVDTTKYSFFSALPAGVAMSMDILFNYAKQFRIIFNPRLKGYKQLGGFATIAKVYPDTWDWTTFWSATALISLILAFMNVLPIPMLDGGYAIFTLYEIITRRKPSEKFLERAQVVGLILILALLLFANGNDLVRWMTAKFGH